MLGTVLTRLRLLVTSAICNVTTLIQRLLSKITGVLTATQTLFADSLTSLSFQFALIAQKSKVLLALYTILESSIKAALTIVKVAATQIGSLLQTTVAQIRQLVTQLLNKGK